jgi:hypothetical protein
MVEVAIDIGRTLLPSIMQWPQHLVKERELPKLVQRRALISQYSLPGSVTWSSNSYSASIVESRAAEPSRSDPGCVHNLDRSSRSRGPTQVLVKAA